MLCRVANLRGAAACCSGVRVCRKKTGQDKSRDMTPDLNSQPCGASVGRRGKLGVEGAAVDWWQPLPPTAPHITACFHGVG